MTKAELIEYCLTYPSAYEDYPFDEHTAIIRHSGTKKMFALIDVNENGVYINLKCDPMRADFLRGAFSGVKPGYHMNKTHWNTITVESDVPEDELYALIAHSFELTKPKKK